MPEVMDNFRSWNGGKLARVACPFDSNHTDGGYVGQNAGGSIVAGCHHQSCQDKKWQDFRAIKEGVAPVTVKSIPASNANPPSTWQDPMPLEKVIGDSTPSLDEALIPPLLLPYCKDVAHRMQSPIEYSVTALIIGLGALLGNKILLMPKSLDNWRITPNLYGMIVGDAGTLKTPVINECSKIIYKINNELSYQFEKDKKQHTAQVKALESQIKAIKANPKTNQSNLLQLEIQYAELKENPPVQERVLVQDVTIEKLGELLSSNENGLYFLFDELISLFKTIEKPGRDNDKSFLLQAWNGLLTSYIDRIGRGSLKIDKTCLSILGTIQPAVLDNYIKNYSKDQKGDIEGTDGFISRFQMVMFPPKSKNLWQYVNKAPDAEAVNTVNHLMNFCFNWHPNKDVNQWNYKQPNVGEYGIIFNFSAHAFFKKWLTQLMRRLQSDGMSQHMKEHLSKYGALFGKLSLIFHIIEHAHTGSIPTKISKTIVIRAAAFCEYLEEHAKRMYGLKKTENNQVFNAAVTILRHIAEDNFTCNTESDIIRKNWRNCKEASIVKEALILLEANNWLMLQESLPSKKGGKPTTKIILHPQIKNYLRTEDQYMIKVENQKHPTPHLNLLKSALSIKASKVEQIFKLAQPITQQPQTLSQMDDLFLLKKAKMQRQADFSLLI
jgi:hypothetical protein